MKIEEEFGEPDIIALHESGYPRGCYPYLAAKWIREQQEKDDEENQKEA